MSAVAVIQASITQGSAIDRARLLCRRHCGRPAADPRREPDLQVRGDADDTYLVVPGVNTYTCQEEIDHIQTWAADNNLKLNRNKTKEIILSSRREGRHRLRVRTLSV